MGQDIINRTILKFPQLLEDDIESSVNEEVAERIHESEELHELLKDSAIRLGRRKVPKHPTLNNFPYQSMIYPSLATMKSQCTMYK